MSPALEERRFLIPFKSTLLPHLFTDVLVIGAGVAGVRAALEASRRGRDVIVLAKGDGSDSATAFAQGGIASAGDEDSAVMHIEDTLEAGAGLCDHAMVQRLCVEGPAEIQQLLAWQMRFDNDATGKPSLSREGGHGRNRILHTDGAATGRELARCLMDTLGRATDVRLFTSCTAIDLLKDDDGRVRGVVCWHPRYGLQIVWARAVVLASGGAGRLFRETTNPQGSCGDGMAMAFRAGAEIADTEFMQFHPTTLYIAGGVRDLISEAVRGEGARLVMRDGTGIMDGVHPLVDLAPRDVVTARIVDVLSENGEACVYLDARSIGDFASRFPTLAAVLGAFQLDAEVDLIPVHPAAHYTIGGVLSDEDGRSSLDGLFVAGEAAANGVHGANRLASNSLLEGLVFGRRAGAAAAEVEEPSASIPRIHAVVHSVSRGEIDLADVRASLRSIMWRNAGIIRDRMHLEEAHAMINFWSGYCLQTVFEEPEGWEVSGMLTSASLLIRGALAREESRGVHRRREFPNANDRFRARLSWRRGRLEPETVAVGEGART